MPNVKPQDRRRAPRVPADIPLTLKARDAGAPARLKDISTIGLCCTFPEPIPEMTLVHVALDLDQRHHEIDGAVVRCERVAAGKREWEVAVYFTDLTPDLRTRIGNFVDAQLAAR